MSELEVTVVLLNILLSFQTVKLSKQTEGISNDVLLLLEDQAIVP